MGKKTETVFAVVDLAAWHRGWGVRCEYRTEAQYDAMPGYVDQDTFDRDFCSRWNNGAGSDNWAAFRVSVPEGVSPNAVIDAAFRAEYEGGAE